MLLCFHLALMCWGVVFLSLRRFTGEWGPGPRLGFLRLAEAVITWTTLGWLLSPSSLPHPQMFVPALASLPWRQQSCLRDHTGISTTSLFFWPGDFSTVPALQPGSASNRTNSSAHKMKGTIRQAAGWAQGMLKAAGASMPPEVPPQPKRVGKRKKKKR